eukprot:CAMPEP_0175579248 /NCGR_PEP_ID=MMETSP0096-20121207/46498_1 /TAXON_ID=311494 /ORGANISM="Alexandrium monilatum, Strain CCMP3105" /LENGTH=80 /DNA_ID=CAMNT_0016882833 /DNA_START=12 /DNA_END=251 /DNA_ORIENTATION=-
MGPGKWCAGGPSHCTGVGEPRVEFATELGKLVGVVEVGKEEGGEVHEQQEVGGVTARRQGVVSPEGDRVAHVFDRVECGQ